MQSGRTKPVLRRWLRRAILLATAFICAYVTLPLWLPTSWLHGWIITRLQRDFNNRRVSLGSVTVSWSEGVRLANLVVADLPNDSGGDLLRIEEVSCPLSPLRMIFTGRLDRLQVRAPTLRIVRDGSDRLNVADLVWQSPSANAGLLRVCPRIQCTDVRVLLGPTRSRPAGQLHLSALDLNGPSFADGIRTACFGRFAYDPPGGPPRELGHFAINAGSSPTQRGGGLAGLAGDVRLSYHSVRLEDLAGLDPALARRLGIRSLAGLCSGLVTASVDSAGRIDWRIEASLDDVRIEAGDCGPVAPNRIRLTLSGHYDMLSDHSVLDPLRVQCPGLDLVVAIDYHPRPGRGRLDMRIERCVVAPAVLRSVAPLLFESLAPGWRLDGAAELAGRLVWTDTFRELSLSADATGLDAELPGVLVKPAGMAATVSLHGRHDQDVDRLKLDNLYARIGGTSVSLTATADELYPLSTGRLELWDVWLNWLADAAFETVDAEELLACVPALQPALTGVRVAGPLRGRVQFEPIRDGGDDGPIVARQLTASAELAGVLRVERAGTVLLDKSADEPLKLVVQARFAPAAPTIDVGRCVVTLGQRGELAVDDIRGKLAVTGPPGTAEPDLHVVLDGTIRARQLERLTALCPAAAERLAAKGGDWSGDLDGRFNLRLGPDLMRGRVALRLDGLGVRLAAPLPPELARNMPPGLSAVNLVKTPSQPASVEINYTSYPLPGGERFAETRLDWAGLGLTACLERTVNGDRELRSLRFDVSDIAALASHFPSPPALAGWRATGRLAGTLEWAPGPLHTARLALDATALEIESANRWAACKPAGMPLLVELDVQSDAPNAPASPVLRLRRGRLCVGQCDLRIRGSAQFLPVGWSSPGAAPIDDLNLAVSGKVVLDEQLKGLWPQLSRRADAVGLAGQCDLFAHLTGGWRGLELFSRIEAAKLSADWPGRLVKPIGVPARGTIDLSVGPAFNLCRVRRAQVSLGKVAVNAEGELFRPSGEEGPINFDARIAFDAPDLAEADRLCPLLSHRAGLALTGPLSGRAAGRLHLFVTGSDPESSDQPMRICLLPSRLDVDARCSLSDLPLSARGRIEMSAHELFIPRLAVRLGNTDVSVSACVSEPTVRPAGWLDLAGRSLDVDELAGLWADLRSTPLPPPRPGQGQDNAAPANAARGVVDFLARCDLAGRVHIADLFVTDAKNQTRHRLAEFTSRFTVDAGQVVVPFQTAMEGGVVRGRLASDLFEPVPMLAVEYDAERLFPTDKVQPLVEAFFPGMTINGRVTMKEKSRSKLLPEPGDPNFPVGSGEIVFEDGLLVGQAGPDWMTRIFPGLKLTRYRFKKMHDWFKLVPDGKAEHHMIFEGTSYDIYMIGYTHRGTGQASYSVGVDLLASLDSKTWSVELQQGKVPLMDVSGVIRNRKLDEAAYSLVPPTTALYQMLIRDNIIYRGVIERAIRRNRDSDTQMR